MITFYKYHGTGNDFILIDNREGSFDINDNELIKSLCHRRFGVGADGIMLVEEAHGYDFKMVYANSDGSLGAMCGNGGRCIVHFAHTTLGMVNDPLHVKFVAPDGEHEAEIRGDIVKLKMQNVGSISDRNGHHFLCSGTTPHNVVFVEKLADFPVVETGRSIRQIDPDGVNVNFVEQFGEVFNVRTYERGVEDETYACGTGATSVAILVHNLGMTEKNEVHVRMPGGNLTINFEKSEDGTYQNIWLTGEARCVFKGEII